MKLKFIFSCTLICWICYFKVIQHFFFNYFKRFYFSTFFNFPSQISSNSVYFLSNPFATFNLPRESDFFSCRASFKIVNCSQPINVTRDWLEHKENIAWVNESEWQDVCSSILIANITLLPLNISCMFFFCLFERRLEKSKIVGSISRKTGLKDTRKKRLWDIPRDFKFEMVGGGRSFKC